MKLIELIDKGEMWGGEETSREETSDFQEVAKTNKKVTSKLFLRLASMNLLS